MLVSIVIPTLAAGEPLAECLASIRAQTHQPVETFVIDNSAAGKARGVDGIDAVQVIENSTNLGVGAAANQGIAASKGEFVMVLNDDAVLDPNAVEQLAAEMKKRFEIGMCAPQIRLRGKGAIDSAGMLITADGLGKQRGHGEAPENFAQAGESLFPSGCAAMYRRAMLDEVGGFADPFFLYCEDTDLGLRARWKAWECRYVPDAVVEHRYSESAGKASALKAYYVERNRILTVLRNFPFRMLLLSFLHTAARYWWHWRMRSAGRGAAASYAGDESLGSIAFRAWRDAFAELPSAWKQRKSIQGSGRLSPKQFERLLSGFRITAKQVASQ